MILPSGERVYDLVSGAGSRVLLLRLSVLGGGKAAKLSCLTGGHSLRLFGRLSYAHACQDVFGSEGVFAKESTSLIIRPDVLCCPK